MHSIDCDHGVKIKRNGNFIRIM